MPEQNHEDNSRRPESEDHDDEMGIEHLPLFSHLIETGTVKRIRALSLVHYWYQNIVIRSA